MARKYINPAKSAPAVTDRVLDEARARAAVAAERLQAAEDADPAHPGWESEYGAASADARAAQRRVEGLERLRAAQLERSGKRDAAVKAAAPELADLAAGLAASRDQVAAAAAEHLRALATLASATDAHNRLLAGAHARVAELGLRVRDDLCDVEAGEEHPEGVLDGGGVRAGGVNWTPVPAAGLAAHALQQALGSGVGPMHMALIGRYVWRAHEVESRPDGLRVPSLGDVGAALPPVPPAAVAPQRPVVRDLIGERRPA